MIIGIIFLLLVSTGNAQSFYSSRNLSQLSEEELTLYYHKALILERQGETLAITGAAAGLLGLLGGAVLNNRCSSAGDDIMCITAATFLGAGVAATIIGFTMYFTGITRINKINQIQLTQSLHLEFSPEVFYSFQHQNYKPGITLQFHF
ncbi:hypothetical protein [uncultured Draconibacterium sp.]|uniref:hypothetical protein n=1 Tax=uncultured Draconibacterium sp. TaxID=1573823 RepID=UPI0029C9A481|nr:hypothetical protein [uncultured Draconibacterium sp.]